MLSANIKTSSKIRHNDPDKWSPNLRFARPSKTETIGTLWWLRTSGLRAGGRNKRIGP
jgi:hypothetical protein